MTVPLRFDQLSAARQQGIRANLAKMQAQGAPPQDVEAYLRDVEHLAPVGGSTAPTPVPPTESAALPQPNQESHLIGALHAIGRGAVPFANDLMSAAVKLGSFGSADMGKVRNVLQRQSETYDKAHPIESAGEQITGALGSGLLTGFGGLAGKAAEAVIPEQLVKNAPKIAKAAEIGLKAAEGAGVGSIYSAGAARPGERLQAAKEGAPVGAAGAVVAEPLLAGLNKVGRTVLNSLNLRPSESTLFGKTVTQATPINSVEEEARHVILNKLQQAGLTPEDAAAKLATPSATGKPLTLTEVGGVPMQRLARGINTGSPETSGKLQQAFLGRGAGSEERILDDLLNATGHADEPSAYRTTQGLLAKRTAQANKGYGEVFGAGTTVPLDAATVPAEGEEAVTLGDLLKRPSMQQAGKYVREVAAERGEPIPDLPTEKSAETDKANLAKLLEMGVPEDQAKAALASGKNGAQAVGLDVLHQYKIKLDDMLGYAKTRGVLPDGSAATRSKLLAIQDTRAKLLQLMDQASQGYQKVRGDFAGDSGLMDAVELGAKHFTEDPEVAADALKKMTPAEQELYRRAGVDALRQRLEAGPVQQDVSNVRGLSQRTLDQKRLRLLFPDEASFSAFKDKLAHEAAMAQTNRTVFTGSNTADKLMDLADMAGVTPQHILKAASGVGGVANMALKFALARRMLGYQGNLARELQPYLTAGANGDLEARSKLLAQLIEHAKTKGYNPATAKFPAGAAVAGHRTGDHLLTTMGVAGSQSPSPQ